MRRRFARFVRNTNAQQRLRRGAGTAACSQAQTVLQEAGAAIVGLSDSLQACVVTALLHAMQHEKASACTAANFDASLVLVPRRNLCDDR